MAGGAEVRGHDRVFVLLGEGGEHWGEYWLDGYQDIRTYVT